MAVVGCGGMVDGRVRGGGVRRLWRYGDEGVRRRRGTVARGLRVQAVAPDEINAYADMYCSVGFDIIILYYIMYYYNIVCFFFFTRITLHYSRFLCVVVSGHGKGGG